MNWLDSIPINLLNKDLDGLWSRQQAISDNLANIDTPGYKSKQVSFEDQLASLLTGNPVGTQNEIVNQIKETEPSTSVSTDKTSRLDGNNIDAEQQNIEMARTQLNYAYSLRELSDYFSRLKYAITDGKS
ncbi:MAG TPA: flagellar basal body rod protein FlgB [Caproiciproducens sp.]|nr:flagellar basal body rod protein FlgB [Caproiciproducens sp.]